MSTAQLIVVGYAALAVEGVLLFRALVEGSATALILAILVAAAVLIYFLKPHPMARKLVVVGVMVLPLAVFAGWYWGWDYYQQSRANAAAESQAAAFVKEHIPEQWQREHPAVHDPQSMVLLWNLEQDQRAAEERDAEQAKKRDAEEKARIAARLKVGDRVWVPNNDYRYLGDRVAAGLEAYDGRSRLYGTVVDIARGRYAVRWDCGACKGSNEVVWHDGSDLNFVSRKPDTVKP